MSCRQFLGVRAAQLGMLALTYTNPAKQRYIIPSPLHLLFLLVRGSELLPVSAGSVLGLLQLQTIMRAAQYRVEEGQEAVTVYLVPKNKLNSVDVNLNVNVDGTNGAACWLVDDGCDCGWDDGTMGTMLNLIYQLDETLEWVWWLGIDDRLGLVGTAGEQFCCWDHSFEREINPMAKENGLALAS
ncbi:hypothetical protein K435DRAFT_801696 [Dendrothele bispora CBS 962.96]|uniref:Uncharacterized protein n=1 Tax=Dendrothele bispora (strain CBS 962.96) TaxID=1314807 RepID=A0A4S8LPV8_DENBC|nr:hypothetical protein K435DRAFT_801696 [Dendrothele bispora CBS 962.96]